MTETRTKFTVTGTAEKHIRAERATIHLHISAKSPTSKTEAYAKVAEVHNRLEAAARGFRDAKAATWHRATAPLSYATKEYADGNRDEVRTVFVTQSSVEVKFQDFQVLADWLAELADEPLVSSGSPVWALTERTRKDNESGVRTAAVKNARKLANDFAAGEDIDPEWLTLAKVDARPGSHQYLGAGATRSAAAGNQAMSITPNEVTISSTVTATFIADRV